MEIGTDISQKIRSAIKAKLMELGAYVDEELPDYIMVMVANRKSEDAMTDDLNLFLGGNTEKFTSWLHSLLEKLQSISTVSLQDKKKEDKSKPIKESAVKSIDQKTVKTSHRKSTEKVEHKKSTEKVEHRKSTEKVEHRKSTEKVEHQKSTEKVEHRKSTEKVEHSAPIKSKTEISAKEITLEKASTVASKAPKALPKPVQESSTLTAEHSKTVAEPTNDQVVKQTEPPSKSAEPVSINQTVLVSKSVPISTQIENTVIVANKEVIFDAVDNTPEDSDVSREATPQPDVTETQSVDVSEEPEFTVKAEYDEFSEEFTQEAEKLALAEKAQTQASKGRAAVIRERITLPRDVKEERLVTPTTTVFARISPMKPSRDMVEVVPRVRSLSSRLGSVPVQSQIVRSVSRHATGTVRNVSLESTSSQVHVPTRESLRQDVTVSKVTGIKRRMPGSIVGSVNLKSRRVVEEEIKEEQYDPLNPAVGNVASVVKVTARRSSVPRKLQANKSLLMKAMNEATKSVGGNRQSRATAFIPLERSVERGASQSRTLFTRSRRDEIMRSLKRDALKEQSSISLRLGAIKQPIVKMEVLAQEEPEDEMESVDLSDVVKHEMEVQQGEITEGGDLGEYVDDSRLVNVTYKPTRIYQTTEIVETEEFMISDNDSQDEVQQVYMIKSEPATVIKVEPEEQLIKFTPTNRVQPREQQVSTQQQSTEQLKTATRQVKEKQVPEVVPENTRFIVTLDGVDPLKFEGESEPVAEVEDTSSVSSKTGSVIPVAPVKPKRQKVETVSINLTASDAENDDDDDTTEEVTKTERCKFWPACSNGNQCAYHHPCTPCRSFPNCKFGDKCLYIHPNCKFDAKCSKSDCPFTHASKRPPAQTQIVSQYIPIPAPPAAALLYSVPTPRPTRPNLAAAKPNCRFFPKCTNMNCPFTHPKLCRYGVSCGNKATCTFHHPTLPTKDQFRWSSAGPSAKTTDHISNRKFDKGAALPTPVPVSKT